MVSSLFLLFILYLTYPISSYNLFSIQESLTTICQQFPLVPAANNSDLQCARLRIDANVSTSAFDLDKPTQIIVFIIIDQSSSDLSLVDISIDFNSSSDSPSSIREIRLCLLVTGSNFTINNQTTTEYTPYEILIFHWQISIENTYDLIDLVPLENEDYKTDKSLCKWDSNRWNRLFNGNMSNNASYVYFLKTTNPQLTFTLIDTNNIALLSSPPSPYLNILYCIPYKLDTTEIILIICFGVFFILSIIILSILHYLKGGDEDRARHFERYQHHHQHHHHRGIQERFTRNHSKKVRHRSSASMSSDEQKDQNT